MGANKISQYTSPFLALEFKEKQNSFYIPRFFLEGQIQFSDTNTYIVRCSEQVGYTFIHFLYTGEYQALEIDDEDEDESKTWGELRIAVQVLLTLSYWRYPKLEELVHSKIKSLCKSICLYDALRLIDEELEKDPIEGTEDQEDWLANLLMTSLNISIENNSVDRADLSLFKGLRCVRLLQFFTTKLFESYMYQISVKNEGSQKPNIESQDMNSVSAVTLTPDTSYDEEFEINFEDEVTEIPPGETQEW